MSMYRESERRKKERESEEERGKHLSKVVRPYFITSVSPADEVASGVSSFFHFASEFEVHEAGA